ncbi:ABC transporter permease [Nitratireductor pacificus]|uniref:Binding-protein-dependent transporter inner membrane component n=1 Tax=Nitratireductor pacificus pht-3B TaxID=391937 RepID=K2N8L7_9HYPH|nr:ABC transporter permease subunit [Nitratireductor pacificus]EKF20453.1 binding-protein-dependent transporter inner membrane component [Nitratireductor pacificus pht-3B]
MSGLLRQAGQWLNPPFLISLAMLAIVWEFAGRSADILTLPPLSAVLAAFVRLWSSGVLTAPLLDSTIALLTGLAISLFVGSAVGIAIGLSRVADVALGPFIKAGLSAPMIAFVPVFMMIFGIGSETRIATVIAFSIFVVATNAATAVRSTDPALLEMARSFGAGRWRILGEIRLPAGAPYFLAGLRLGVARGIKGLINGEVLIAIMGMGGLVKKYGTVFSMDQLYAVILLIVLYAAIWVGAVTLLGRLVLTERRK